MAGIKVVFDMSDRLAQRSIDAKKLQEKLEKAQLRNLYKSGAIVKTIAQRSIKRSKWKPLKYKQKIGERQKGSGKNFVHDYLEKKVIKSEKKKPPRAHVDSGEFGLKSIAYALTSRKDACIIGPLGKPNGFVKKIEEGGTVDTVIPTWARKKRKLPAVIKRKIGKRPFMKPALDTFIEKYPKIWKGAIK